MHLYQEIVLFGEMSEKPEDGRDPSSRSTERLGREKDAHSHAFAWHAFYCQATAGDSKQGAMRQQAAASSGSRADSRPDADAIICDDNFQMRITGCLDQHMQATMHIGAASMSGSIAQRLLHSGKDQLGNGGRHKLTDMARCLLRNLPCDF